MLLLLPHIVCLLCCHVTMFCAVSGLRVEGPGCAADTCFLPDCHCDPNIHPAQLLDKSELPQIVNFVFAGPINEKVRKLLKDIFPSSQKNPNGCPISITVFVSGQYTDYCSVHAMYVRGHEIGTNGVNRTFPEGWTISKWKTEIGRHRTELSRLAYVPLSEIKGMRAPFTQPGGDEQFSMMYEEGLTYDSSLLSGVKNVTGLWPFSIDGSVVDCQNSQATSCPKGRYPGLWEIPVSVLTQIKHPCSYLEECAVNLNGEKEIFEFLLRNFERNYYSHNRAPLQVNLREDSIFDEDTREALKEFLKYLVTREDTWMVSLGEMLAWVKKPMSWRRAVWHPAWECPDRQFNVICKNVTGLTRKVAALGSILNLEQLLIWEYVLLAVLYIVLLKYDRMQEEVVYRVWYS